MRFYLDLPLVLGYTLMATTACIGMLQYAGARGGYVGLSLFSSDPKYGKRIGAALTVGAVVAYVLLAPEINTPGPAGSEVAGLFGLCALGALGITLFGSDIRLRYARSNMPEDGDEFALGDYKVTFFAPLSQHGDPAKKIARRAAIVLVLLDPTRFVAATQVAVRGLRESGIAVLLMDAQSERINNLLLLPLTFLANMESVIKWVDVHPSVDSRRIGVLGLGLGADAALNFVSDLPQIKATVAVSPLIAAPLVPQVTPVSLSWLRELSYLQVLRWRKHWSTTQHIASDLTTARKLQPTSPTPAVAVQGTHSMFTTRIPFGSVEFVSAPDDRFFSILEDKQAAEATANWLMRKLV